MAQLIYDRYATTSNTTSVPGDGTPYGFQITPLQAGDVLLGAAGYLDGPGNDKLPLVLEFADSPTWGENNVVLVTAQWDDGAGGAGAPATANVTAVFAKAIEL